jgi:hypothetical protein
MKIKKEDIKLEWGWGCTSVVKHLPSMYEALGLIPNTTKT